MRRTFAPRAPTRLVAVVVPLSSDPELSADEEVSLRHVCHFLGGYDRFLIAPRGSGAARDGFTTLEFSHRFFGSATAHHRLLMWRGFYRAFQDYQYILIHHLDALTLSNDLDRWCAAGWDYIGAPWLPCDDTPWVKEPHVGNGGFTLMKVASALEVLHNRHHLEPHSYVADLVIRNGDLLRPLFRTATRLAEPAGRPAPLQRVLQFWERHEALALNGLNNDYFWSFDAVRYLPSFSVAPVAEGLRFAFEAAPRTCFELNHRQMPFGCHAWTKFDRAFWEPHLLAAD